MFNIYGDYDGYSLNSDFSGTYDECVAELRRMADVAASSRSRHTMRVVLGVDSLGRVCATEGGSFHYYIGTSEDDICGMAF